MASKDLMAWQANAKFWDEAMGEESNLFHRETIRPKVNALLEVTPDDYILDIACGNGNYSAYLASLGVKVVACDFSSSMLDCAKKRQAKYLDKIEFVLADASSYTFMQELKRAKPYTKAVSNMAIMDIRDIKPLFKSVNALLDLNGIFVFATQHPCFVTLTDKYKTSHSYLGEAIKGQPQKQIYYHRSLEEIFNICFEYGFIIDGFLESYYILDKEKPVVVIVRAKKIKNLA